MLPAQANSTRGGEVAESDERQAVSKQKTGGNSGTAVYKLEPPTLCFNALESSTANTGAVPSWHRGWHRFCWHGDGPLLEKEAFSLPWPEKSCCTSSTGHTLSCLTLCDIVSVSENGSGIWVSFLMYFEIFFTSFYFHTQQLMMNNNFASSWNCFCCKTKKM